MFSKDIFQLLEKSLVNSTICIRTADSEELLQDAEWDVITVSKSDFDYLVETEGDSVFSITELCRKD